MAEKNWNGEKQAVPEVLGAESGKQSAPEILFPDPGCILGSQKQTQTPVEEPVVKEQYAPEKDFELGAIGENYFIRKYIGSSKAVSIPPVIRGRSVVAIGEKAFFSYQNLEMVIIPPSVRRIEDGAFHKCAGLKRVIAHKDVEFIGSLAFAGCNQLCKADFGMGSFPDGVVKFSPGLKVIGSNAFSRINYGLLFHSMQPSCCFKEVNLYKKTKVRSAGSTFNTKFCAIFRYE